MSIGLFQKGGTGDHVHSVILGAFPQLQEGGGYEILRTGDRGNRSLIVLEIPPGGYSVNYLKSTLGSAKAYLRPLQKDIPLLAGRKANASNSKVNLLLNLFTFLINTNKCEIQGGPILDRGLKTGPYLRHLILKNPYPIQDKLGKMDPI